MAINSPLLDISIEGAKGVLFAISGGPDLTMVEVQNAATIITESIRPGRQSHLRHHQRRKIKEGGDKSYRHQPPVFRRERLPGSASSIIGENFHCLLKRQFIQRK